ncbi:MAG: tetratricopeptide repeat protein, partial [Bacteroidota bacterium]|nr:tetratricopeptide repeat protein [Bacteroidota bacterium]
ANYKLAKLELAYRNYDMALQLLNRVLKVDKDNFSAYSLKGVVYKEKKEIDKAIKSFRKSLSCNESYEEAYIQLGILYAEKNDRLAIEYFNGALNNNPENIDALYLLGVFYQKNYDMEDAEKIYKRIINIDSTNQYSYYNLGYINLVFHEDFGKAASFFQKAIDIDPNYLEAYYNLGYSYELSDEYQKAKLNYQKVLKMDKDYKKAIEGLNRLDNII